MAVGLLDVQGDLMYRVLVQLKYRVQGAGELGIRFNRGGFTTSFNKFNHLSSWNQNSKMQYVQN